MVKPLFLVDKNNRNPVVLHPWLPNTPSTQLSTLAIYSSEILIHQSPSPKKSFLVFKLPIFLEFFPPTNSLLCVYPWNVRLSWPKIQKQQVWFFLDVATNARCRRGEYIWCHAPFKVAQGEAIVFAFWWKCEGHRGGNCQEARERGSVRSSPTPEKRADTLPEWKQRVSDRKRHHQCANETWYTGNAAQLLIRKKKAHLHPLFPGLARCSIVYGECGQGGRAFTNPSSWVS